MSQIDDMNAVNDYFVRTVPINSDAIMHRDAWFAWFNKLGPVDKRLSSSVWDEARARRNQFNLVNTRDPLERAKVSQVLASGITTEDVAGKSPAVVEAKRQEIREMGERIAKEIKIAGPTYPTIRLGSKGEVVKRWQTILHLEATGNFDSITDSSTKAFQKSKGLVADGIVGPKTWSAALGKPVNPSPPPPAPVPQPTPRPVTTSPPVVSKPKLENTGPAPVAQASPAATVSTKLDETDYTKVVQTVGTGMIGVSIAKLLNRYLEKR